MNGHGSPHTYGNTALLSRFECENLSKAAYIQPLLTGQAGIFLRILSLFHGLFGPVAEAFAAVITAVAGLDKDALSQVLHPVADFAFDTHVRNLTKTVVVRAGAVAVQGVAVGVCHADADQRHKINLIFKVSILHILRHSFRFVISGLFFLVSALRWW